MLVSGEMKYPHTDLSEVTWMAGKKGRDRKRETGRGREKEGRDRKRERERGREREGRERGER